MAAGDGDGSPTGVPLTPITEEELSVYSPVIDTLDEFEENMDDSPTQHRLYMINRGGAGEVQYILLNKERTEFASYSVRLETWRIIKNIAYFGVAVVDNVLYVIGGFDKINCRHLHRVLK